MRLGLVLVGLAAVSWGTTGATMALLARDTEVGPLFVGWARMAVAAPCLAALAIAARRTAAGRRQPALPPARDAALYALLGAAMAAYQVCYFRAVTLAGVAATALLAICSAPVLMALLARVALGERLRPPVVAALGLAVGGTALLLAGPRGPAAAAGGLGPGGALALGAGLAYAVYAVAAKRALARTAPASVAALTFAAAALLLAPVLAFERVHPGDLERALPLLLYLGVGPTAVAYALFTAGLRRVPTAAAGVASLLEPFTAATLGVIAFGESLGPLGWTGAALLAIALLLLVGGRG